MENQRNKFSRAAVAALLLILIILSSCGKTQIEGSSSNKALPYEEFEVEGEVVTYEELKYFENRLKNAVKSEYAKSGVSPSGKDFWSTPIDGVTPEKALREKAIAEAEKAKKILIQAKTEGIYDDISWNGLESLAKKYNADHKTGGVGLKEIDLDNFYIYYVEDAKIKLEITND